MASVKRGGRDRSINTAPQKSQFEQDGYITTLHPDGSANSIRHDMEKRNALERPEIRYLRAVFNVLIPLFLCYAVVCLWSSSYALLFLGIYVLVRLRSILVFLIRVYQRYASADVRLSCVFEPSCSEYMILCLKKYGIIRGVIKGVKRLKRCRYPNSGEDYP